MDKKVMKKEWAQFVQDKNNHSYKDPKYGNKVKGNLKAEHYIIYNILRGLPKERGFEPLGEGYKLAICKVESSIRFSRIENLIQPFNKSVTIDELRSLL